MVSCVDCLVDEEVFVVGFHDVGCVFYIFMVLFCFLIGLLIPRTAAFTYSHL